MSVPKLRFLEFQDALEWESRKLGDIAPLQRGFDLPSDQIQAGSIPVVYSNGVQKFHSKGMAKGPGLVTGRSGTIGKINFIKEGDYWAHNTTLWVTSFKGNIPKFVYYLYKFIGTTRFASGSGVPTLNRNDVHAFQTYLPTSLLEQQKIADCLTSLESVITAQSQKLEALGVHKRGLMQQLFPSEGETVPKLRFLEFQDAGDWEEKVILGLSTVGLSNGIFNDPKKVGRGYKLVNVSDMYIDSTINENNLSLIEISKDEFLKNKVENGDIFFTRSSLVKSGIAHSNIYLGYSDDITFDGHLIRLRPNKKIVVSIFAHYLLKTEYIRGQLVARGKTATMTTIGQSDVGVVKLSIPSLLEQQKIADCLTTLEQLITAQKQKLELLKSHKKGLMQQLFPAPDEAQT